MSHHRWVALSAATFLLSLLGVAAMIGPLPGEFVFLVALGLVLAAACWVFEKIMIDAFDRLEEWSLILRGFEFIGWVVYCVATALIAS